VDVFYPQISQISADFWRAKPHDLGNGVTVFLPSWRDLALDGKDREGVGITPDVVVETKREDFEMGDPIVVRALDLIREKP
jgi:C-terminal processing protease CtpA/Prc